MNKLKNQIKLKMAVSLDIQVTYFVTLLQKWATTSVISIYTHVPKIQNNLKVIIICWIICIKIYIF